MASRPYLRQLKKYFCKYGSPVGNPCQLEFPTYDPASTGHFGQVVAFGAVFSSSRGDQQRERIDTELATTKNNGYFLHNGMFTALNLLCFFPCYFAVFLLCTL